MNHSYAFAKTDVAAILDHGKSWFRSEPPMVCYIEDEEPVQAALAARLKPRFPGLEMKCARSIGGTKQLFDADDAVFDVIILDHRILVSEENDRIGTEDELAEFLAYLLRVGETRCGFLIRVTAFLEQASNASRSAKSQSELLRLSCLVQKTTGWDDIVLAYIYRAMALKAYRQLDEAMRQFDFDRLNGTAPAARPRYGRLDGFQDFEKLLAELRLWWPFLSRWPEDAIQTRMLLSPLLRFVRHHFNVDETGLNNELGEGEARLTLKYQPGPIRP